MAITVLDEEYALIAADITALTAIQVPDLLTGEPAFAEVLASVGAPSEATRGIMMAAGDTAIGDTIASIGAAGGLYARLYHPRFAASLYTA